TSGNDQETGASTIAAPPLYFSPEDCAALADTSNVPDLAGAFSASVASTSAGVVAARTTDQLVDSCVKIAQRIVHAKKSTTVLNGIIFTAEAHHVAQRLQAKCIGSTSPATTHMSFFTSIDEFEKHLESAISLPDSNAAPPRRDAI